MILRKTEYELVEKNMFNYSNYKKYLELHKDMIIESSSIELGSGSNSGMHSDQTSKKALALCSEEIVLTEKWVKVVDLTIKRFENMEHIILLKERYFSKKTLNEIQEEHHISHTTVYKWREDIVIYATFQALQLNLLKIK